MLTLNCSILKKSLSTIKSASESCWQRNDVDNLLRCKTACLMTLGPKDRIFIHKETIETVARSWKLQSRTDLTIRSVEAYLISAKERAVNPLIMTEVVAVLQCARGVKWISVHRRNLRMAVLSPMPLTRATHKSLSLWIQTMVRAWNIISTRLMTMS